jgi:hypothetical protein
MRHFRVCVPILEDSAEDADAVSASDTELQKLLVDSNELFLQPRWPGQMSAAASALACRGRAGNEPGRREEWKQSTADALATADPTDKTTWSDSVTSFVARHLDSLLERTA